MVDLHLEPDTRLAPPRTVGNVTLTRLPVVPRALIAPFKGQGLALGDALKSLTGLKLPPVGHVAGNKSRRVQWFGHGKWLLTGQDVAATGAAFDGIAAVTDQSDAWIALQLQGDAAPVMARLCPLDLHGLASGRTARTGVARLPAALTRHKDGLEILLPRSAGDWGVAEILKAMKSLAATQALISRAP